MVVALVESHSDLGESVLGPDHVLLVHAQDEQGEGEKVKDECFPTVLRGLHFPKSRSTNQKFNF